MSLGNPHHLNPSLCFLCDVRALTISAQGKDAHGQGIEEKIFSDEELQSLIDPILTTDDLSRDGFIDYPEFIRAQQKAAANKKQQDDDDRRRRWEKEDWKFFFIFTFFYAFCSSKWVTVIDEKILPEKTTVKIQISNLQTAQEQYGPQ